MKEILQGALIIVLVGIFFAALNPERVAEKLARIQVIYTQTLNKEIK